MKKQFAVFDIDGTVFRWQLFHELVFELSHMGLFPADVSEQLEHAFLEWRGLHATWHDYESAVVHAVESHITTIKPSQLELAAEHVVSRSGHKVYAYTSKLVSDLKDQGYVLIALSGSHQEIVELFAKRHGFNYCIGLLQERTGEDSYSGKFERFVVDKKDVLLTEFVKTHDLSMGGSYAVGDSESDAPMLALVDNPIAFNPSSGLFAIAKENHWPVVLERKDMAYRMEWDGSDYIVKEAVEVL